MLAPAERARKRGAGERPCEVDNLRYDDGECAYCGSARGAPCRWTQMLREKKE
jgi:hypothetical protein